MKNEDQDLAHCDDYGDANAAIRFIARTAGDLHGAFLQELLQELSRLGNNEEAFAKNLVGRLNSDGLINDGEVGLLVELIDVFVDESSIASSAPRVESIYSAIATADHPSPITLAIAGVGLNAMMTASHEELGVSVAYLVQARFSTAL